MMCKGEDAAVTRRNEAGMKIGIIGAAGHWGYALAHLPKHTVVGIAPGYEGESMERVQASLEKAGIKTRIYEDYRQLLDLARVMIVNTRFDRNAGITAECLKKDIYVFSEKPLAMNLQELDMLKNVQEHSKAFVTAMFGIRYTSWFLTMKEAVKDIGEIRLLNGQKSYKLGIRPDFYKKQETFGGIIPWVAIHAIDWIHALTQVEFKSVRAVTNNDYNKENGDLEMTALCMFELENGILASVSADYFRPQAAPTHDDDRIRVVGTEGIAEYADGVVRRIDKDGVTVLQQEEEQDVFELFLRRVNGEDAGVTSQESFYMTEIALKARDSARA